MRSSISTFLMKTEIGMVPEDVTLASDATAFLFRKEGIVTLLWEASASTMEGTIDGLPTVALIGAIDALAAAFVVERVTISAVD